MSRDAADTSCAALRRLSRRSSRIARGGTFCRRFFRRLVKVFIDFRYKLVLLCKYGNEPDNQRKTGGASFEDR